MEDDLRPLRGRRIVITRTREQSENLAGCLETLGAQVIFQPMVRFADPLESDRVELERSIVALDTFDWVIFTSANAVKYFMNCCASLGNPPQTWPQIAVAIAVVGPATRDALEGYGLHSAMMPGEFSGAGLCAELGPKLAGKRVLLPRSDRAGAELPASLRAAGASVTEVVAYRTTSVEAPESVEPAGSLDDADAITFFSPSAFHNFEHAFADGALQKMAARAVFVAVGPVTASAMREAGLSRVIEAAEATSASVAEAVTGALVGALGFRPTPLAARERTS